MRVHMTMQLFSGASVKEKLTVSYIDPLDTILRARQFTDVRSTFLPFSLNRNLFLFLAVHFIILPRKCKMHNRRI